MAFSDSAAVLPRGGSTPSTQSRALPLRVFADECGDAPADGLMRCGIGSDVDHLISGRLSAAPTAVAAFNTFA